MSERPQDISGRDVHKVGEERFRCKEKEIHNTINKPIQKAKTSYYKNTTLQTSKVYGF